MPEAIAPAQPGIAVDRFAREIVGFNTLLGARSRQLNAKPLGRSLSSIVPNEHVSKRWYNTRLTISAKSLSSYGARSLGTHDNANCTTLCCLLGTIAPALQSANRLFHSQPTPPSEY